MAEAAAHLVDHVFPEVPVRQWVLSLPHPVRYLLARHPDLCREVRGIFVRSVHSFYGRQARDVGRPGGRCGSVVHVQRFASDLRLDIHFHGLFLDGVYTGFESHNPLTFHPAKQLTDDDVASQVRHIATLITGHLRRRGYLDDDLNLLDESAEEHDEEATHHAAAIQGLIPFGPQAGRRNLLFGEELLVPPSPRAKKKLCADVAGYSLHAAVRVGESARERLEKLCRYLARPPLSQDRLSIANNGHIVYRFKKAWRNGKTAVVLDPMTFLSRLAAQVPPRRFHMLTYHGVLAPAASRRDEIVPGHEPGADAGAGGCSSKDVPDGMSRKRQHPERLPWADLVKRVWLAEILCCPCGGRRVVLAMVFDPVAIERILRHLGLPFSRPERAPPRARAGELPFSSE